MIKKQEQLSACSLLFMILFLGVNLVVLEESQADLSIEKSVPLTQSNLFSQDISGYRPAVMIIKFKKESNISAFAEDLFSKKQPFQSLLNDYSLDKLNAKYHVVRFTKLHKDPRSMEEIKEKYSARSKRIPKKSRVPAIGTIYKVEFADKNIDVLKVSREYMDNPHVDYAQPDYVARINKFLSK